MSEWRPIETAPKDRIIVAARVQYGVANPLATVAWNGFAWVYSSCGVSYATEAVICGPAEKLRIHFSFPEKPDQAEQGDSEPLENLAAGLIRCAACGSVSGWACEILCGDGTSHPFDRFLFGDGPK
jgi:hypothetical protein